MGQSDSIVFALPAADPDSIPGIQYGFQSLKGVITESGSRTNSSEHCQV